MTNFANVLSAAVDEHRERPAIKLDDFVLTYGEFNDAVSRAAGLLRTKGVAPGDRVGVQLPNVPYFPIVYFGALRLGAVVVPMNPLLKDREVAYYLSDSGARVLVASHEFAEAAQGGSTASGAECVLTTTGEFDRLLADAEMISDVADRADDDPAVIIYTSGTTGAPKGATLTHANLGAGAQVARNLLDLGPESVGIVTIPLFHVFGMNAMMNDFVLAHGLLTLVPRFDPDKVLEIIERDRATTFAGVPTMFSALLHHPDRERHEVSSLRFCASGGAALPVEVLRGFDEAFGCEVLEGFGLSETTGMASFNLPGRARKPGSVGVPVGGSEFKLVDDLDNDVPEGGRGELVMRGPFVMRGYWNREDATAEVMRGGWFHTGDIATVDDEGYYFIVDRKKDLIIRGGYNVYPRELEEVLYTHPAVREAAVVGIPHDHLGEEVGAAISLKHGEDASPDDLRAFMKERVAAYKYPRQIWVVDELPKGPTGKILKREITLPESDR